jgi:ATP:corrinoid adenosyltransferase
MKEKRYKWRREGYKENTKGLLMVNTGDGKGKTTCALGLLMRAAGRGMRCAMKVIWRPPEQGKWRGRATALRTPRFLQTRPSPGPSE